MGAISATILAGAGIAQHPDMVMDAENLPMIRTTAHPDAVGFCNDFMQAAHDGPDDRMKVRNLRQHGPGWPCFANAGFLGFP